MTIKNSCVYLLNLNLKKKNIKSSATMCRKIMITVVDKVNAGKKMKNLEYFFLYPYLNVCGRFYLSTKNFNWIQNSLLPPNFFGRAFFLYIFFSLVFNAHEFHSEWKRQKKWKARLWSGVFIIEKLFWVVAVYVLCFYITYVL